MSEHKAKIGDKIRLVDLPKDFSDRFKVGDELTVNGFEGIYTRAYIDEENNSLFLPHEYEVLKVLFEPKEVELTKRQFGAIKYYFEEGPRKIDFEHALNLTFKKSWKVERFRCLNDLTPEQIAIAVLRPDRIKIMSEIEYEKINPVTALELWRDEKEVFFKDKRKDEWTVLNGGVLLSMFKSDDYEFSLKKTI